MKFRGYVRISIVLFLMLVSISGCINVPTELTGISLLPIIQTFEASPAIIKAGEYSTLSWTVTGASKVYIDNNIGNVALNGNITVSPSTTTYYTVTASNSSGSSSARTLVTVSDSAISQTPANQPVIQYFFADRNYISPGEGVTLYWDTAETTLVTLDPGGTVKNQGNKTVYPYVTSNYVLAASNPNGIVQNTLTINVSSSSGSQIWPEKTVILPAIQGESGSLIKNNAIYTVQDAACAGDTSLNLTSRAFLSFDISGIPRSAIIDEAILDLSNYVQAGNPSYTGTATGRMAPMVSGMGALEVYFYQYDDFSNLNIMAYNRPATLVNGGNIINYPLSPWTVDVTNSYLGEQVVQNLVQSGQTRCQFRIQFFTSTNWDMKADQLCFDNAGLIIKYREP